MLVINSQLMISAWVILAENYRITEVEFGVGVYYVPVLLPFPPPHYFLNVGEELIEGYGVWFVWLVLVWCWVLWWGWFGVGFFGLGFWVWGFFGFGWVGVFLVCFFFLTMENQLSGQQKCAIYLLCMWFLGCNPVASHFMCSRSN